MCIPTINRNDLDSLLTEQLDSNHCESEEESRVKSALDLLSNNSGIIQTSRSTGARNGNRRSFTTLMRRGNTTSPISKQDHQERSSSFNSTEISKTSDSTDFVTLILHPIANKSKHFTPRRIVIKAGTEVLIGRLANTAIFNLDNEASAIFDCRVLSRQHAVLTNRSGSVYLKDLDSSNGTYINSARIEGQKEVLIKNGDIVQFGQDVLDMSSHQTSKCIIARIELDQPNKSSDLTELKSALDDLESMIDKSRQDKIVKLESTLAQIKSELKQGWKSMFLEDELISKIQSLEDEIINKEENKKKMVELESKLDQLEVFQKETIRHQKLLTYLNIYSSIFLSLLLIAFFTFIGVFGQRQKTLSVW